MSTAVKKASQATLRLLWFGLGAVFSVLWIFAFGFGPALFLSWSIWALPLFLIMIRVTNRITPDMLGSEGRVRRIELYWVSILIGTIGILFLSPSRWTYGMLSGIDLLWMLGITVYVLRRIDLPPHVGQKMAGPE